MLACLISRISHDGVSRFAAPDVRDKYHLDLVADRYRGRNVIPVWVRMLAGYHAWCIPHESDDGFVGFSFFRYRCWKHIGAALDGLSVASTTIRTNLQTPARYLLLTVAAAIGMMVTATLGVAVLSLSGFITHGYLQAWSTWWWGDTMGVVAAAPLVLNLNREEISFFIRRRFEFLGWLISVVVTCLLVFVMNGRESNPALALAFLTMPLMVWAGMRLSATGTSIGVILLSIGAEIGIVAGTGPFKGASPIESMVMLGTYMLTCAVIGWLVRILNDAQHQSAEWTRLFERALDNASLGLWLSDADQRIIYTNDGFTRLTGYDRREAMGKRCSFLFGPASDAATINEFEKAAGDGRNFSGEIIKYRKDGTTFWSSMLTSPIHDESGSMTGFLGTITDLTRLFNAKEVLQLVEERQRLALDAADLGSFKFELDSDWVQLDEQSRRIFAQSKPVVSRADAVLQVHPEDRERVKSEFEKGYQFDGPRTIATEYRIVCNEGEVKWVSVRAKACFAQETGGCIPSHVIGAVRDISDSRRAEERIRASLNEKEAMLKEINHRVKNNLQIISSLLSLQAMSEPSSMTADLLQESQNRIRSMTLVHEALYSSGDFGSIKLADYLDQLCCHLFRSFGTDPSLVRFEMQIEDVTLNLERAVPFGLVVNELISNALKYAFPNGRSGRIGLQIRATSEQRFLLVVDDDGVGLPENFDIKQLRSLGLNLVDDLSKQLNGSFTFQSRDGAEFRLEFPMESTTE